MTDPALYLPVVYVYPAAGALPAGLRLGPLANYKGTLGAIYAGKKAANAAGFSAYTIYVDFEAPYSGAVVPGESVAIFTKG